MSVADRAAAIERLARVVNIAAAHDALSAPVSSAARLVLLVLAVHADRSTREAWPSLPTLATETGLARSTVAVRVAELEAAGVVEISRSRGSAHRYRLTDPSEYWTGNPSDLRSEPVRFGSKTRPATGPKGTARELQGRANGSRTFRHASREPFTTDDGATFLPGTGMVR